MVTARGFHGSPATELLLRKACLQQDMVGQGVGLRARFAQAPRQTLRRDKQQAARQHERWNTHHFQAGDSRRRVIGMQSAQHHVPRLRGLDGYLCGLRIANLADHDDVRILPQQSAQRGGESQSDFFR